MIGYVRFWFWPFSLWPHPVLFVQKCQKIAKSNLIFHLNRREERVLTSAYLDNLMAAFFHWLFWLSLILVIFRGKWEGSGSGGQEGVNVLDLSHFLKNSNLGKNIQTVFLSANILSLLRISPKLDPLGDERPKKTQKGHFMEAEWVPKTWKIF